MDSIELKNFFKNNVSFVESLTESELDGLVKHSRILDLKPTQILYHGGDDCLGFLIVLKGILNVSMLSDEGREITLYKLLSGDKCVLTQSCILSQISFDVYVTAETDCKVLIVSPVYMAQLMKHNQGVELYSYKLIADRFNDVMWAFEQLVFTSFDKRLAGYLLDALRYGEKDVIDKTHEQIARDIGSVREVVSRALKKYADDGAVKLGRGKIQVLNKDYLKNIIKIKS